MRPDAKLSVGLKYELTMYPIDWSCSVCGYLNIVTLSEQEDLYCDDPVEACKNCNTYHTLKRSDIFKLIK